MRPRPSAWRTRIAAVESPRRITMVVVSAEESRAEL
jgi:hypothetical protein